MQRKNLFDGESHKAQFAIITYRWLMSRRWVTYVDIMAERLGRSRKNYLRTCLIVMVMAN